MRFLSLAVLGLSTILIASCANETRRVKTYQDPGYPLQPFDKVLVISHSGQLVDRRTYEHALKQALDGKGGNAVVSHEAVPGKPPASATELRQAIKNTDVDAVLVSRITRAEPDVSTQGGRVQVERRCRAPDKPYDYFLYDYEEHQEPTTLSLSWDVVIVTDLFEATEGRRIWGVQSDCVEQQRLDSIVAAEATFVAEELSRNGYLD